MNKIGISIYILAALTLLAGAASAQTNITIGSGSAAPGGTLTLPLVINNVTDVGLFDVNLTYNASVVHVVSVVGVLPPAGFDFIDFITYNGTGVTRIGAIQMANPGLSGNVKVADITLQAVGHKEASSVLGLVINELLDTTPEQNVIPASVVNGTFIVSDQNPPVVTSPSAKPRLVDDNGIILSTLNVTVTDESSIASVTVNLSLIGGSSVHSMTNVLGTNVWTAHTGAFAAGVHNLQVNATDTWGNSNTSAAIQLIAVKPASVTIGSATVPPGGTVTLPLMINNVSSLAKVATADINLTYNASVVNVIAVTNSAFDYMDSNINNATGVTRIGAMQFGNPGMSGNVKLADVTLKAVGPIEASSVLGLMINELKDDTPDQNTIPAGVLNGSFKIISRGVTLTTDKTSQIVPTGRNATYVLTVNNTGSVIDFYNLTLQNPNNAGVAALNMPNLTLGAGTSGTVLLNVTNAVQGSFVVNVTATSQADQNVNKTISTTTMVVNPAIISIANSTAPPGGKVKVPIIITNVTNLGVADVNLSYNSSVVHVLEVNSSQFDFIDAAINNASGTVRIAAFQTLNPGLSGEVRLAEVTLLAAGGVEDKSIMDLKVNELKDASPQGNDILSIDIDGGFTIAEVTPPVVVNQSAVPPDIPDDTDNVPLWGEETQLNVTVSDESGVACVTINLSALGKSGAEPMTLIAGSSFNGIWSIKTNASAGKVGLHSLAVNAADIYGSSNTSANITLLVLLNGDVSKDGAVSLADAMYLAKHILNKPGFEEINKRTAEVSGDGIVSLFDAMYLAKHVLNKPGFEVLH